jgi:hypothetical protein
MSAEIVGGEIASRKCPKCDRPTKSPFCPKCGTCEWCHERTVSGLECKFD